MDDVLDLNFFECLTTARRSCLSRSLLIDLGLLFNIWVVTALAASKRRNSSMLICFIMVGGRGFEEMDTIFCRMGLGIRHKIVSACLPFEPIRNCGNPLRNARVPSQKCVNTVHGKCNGRYTTTNEEGEDTRVRNASPTNSRGGPNNDGARTAVNLAREYGATFPMPRGPNSLPIKFVEPMRRNAAVSERGNSG